MTQHPAGFLQTVDKTPGESAIPPDPGRAERRQERRAGSVAAPVEVPRSKTADGRVVTPASTNRAPTTPGLKTGAVSQTSGAGAETEIAPQGLTWWQYTSIRRRIMRRGTGPRVAEHRRAAIQEAVESKDQRIPKLLIDCLSDTWVVVREAAAAGLGKLRCREAVRPLIDLAGSDPNADVRRVAALALGAIGDPVAIVPLLKLGVEHARFRTLSIDA
ncbi:MAG: HEAT repeat domain-containing protein, partial [Planctomycetaceae bacterium]